MNTKTYFRTFFFSLRCCILVAGLDQSLIQIYCNDMTPREMARLFGFWLWVFGELVPFLLIMVKSRHT